MKAIVAMKGNVEVSTYPDPVIGDMSVLIKTIYSAVSPGTELGIIQSSKETTHALGYSAVGEVLEVGEKVSDIKKGDMVACYGAPYVFHAERLSVPRNLCVKVPEGVSLKEAAFVGLGGIAIHGVRRAGLQFGESVLILGLGLLGQIISQICHQSNYQVIAADLNENRCRLAETLIPNVYCLSGAAGQNFKEKISELTGGFGVDGVIISAHSNKEGLVDQSLDYVAPQGKIVVVGNILTSFSRERFFQKEADVLISRAAGPGRYDNNYERLSIDYPKGYVRWTEGRNLAEYIRLLMEKRLKMEHLITKEFDYADAKEAYQIVKGNPLALGVLFKY